MILTAQGVTGCLRQRCLRPVAILLLSLLTTTYSLADSGKKHNVYIVLSTESVLHETIAQQVADILLTSDDINVNLVTADQINRPDDEAGLVVSIGADSASISDTLYPSFRKLYITSYPTPGQAEQIRRDGDAVLYMTQPYCRQLKLISLIDKGWDTVGLLYSDKKSASIKAIRSCADKHRLTVYATKKQAEDSFSDQIKEVLTHSDVLLALPDAEIYNSGTVKNILLTSYRLRKPVFAFSKNFVTAGAVAAVHSTTEQIAMSIDDIVRGYFRNDGKFRQTEHYPTDFDIDINRNVIKALGLSQPNVYRTKTLLGVDEDKSEGKTR